MAITTVYVNDAEHYSYCNRCGRMTELPWLRASQLDFGEPLCSTCYHDALRSDVPEPSNGYTLKSLMIVLAGNGVMAGWYCAEKRYLGMILTLAVMVGVSVVVCLLMRD